MNLVNTKLQRVLADSINNFLRRGIEKVLGGEAKRFEIPPFESDTLAISAQSVKTIMERLRWKAGELETNGWQYDWWIEFTKGKRSFTACGSGFYGGFRFYPTKK